MTEQNIKFSFCLFPFAGIDSFNAAGYSNINAFVMHSFLSDVNYLQPLKSAFKIMPSCLIIALSHIIQSNDLREHFEIHVRLKRETQYKT